MAIFDVLKQGRQLADLASFLNNLNLRYAFTMDAKLLPDARFPVPVDCLLHAGNIFIINLYKTSEDVTAIASVA